MFGDGSKSSMVLRKGHLSERGGECGWDIKPQCHPFCSAQVLQILYHCHKNFIEKCSAGDGEDLKTNDHGFPLPRIVESFECSHAPRGHFASKLFDPCIIHRQVAMTKAT